MQPKTEYYINLKKVTEEDNWWDWIMCMLNMVEQTALKGRTQIAEIENLMNIMDQKYSNNCQKYILNI